MKLKNTHKCIENSLPFAYLRIKKIVILLTKIVSIDIFGVLFEILVYIHILAKNDIIFMSILAYCLKSIQIVSSILSKQLIKKVANDIVLILL